MPYAALQPTSKPGRPRFRFICYKRCRLYQFQSGWDPESSNTAIGFMPVLLLAIGVTGLSGMNMANERLEVVYSQHTVGLSRKVYAAMNWNQEEKTG